MADSNNFQGSYIECLLWSSTGDDGEPLDATITDIDDIPSETMSALAIDCSEFLKLAGGLIPDSRMGDAGHDFWLTRNEHGAGFWDGDWPEHGERLTDISKSFGEQTPYLGDNGKLYI